MNNSGWLVNGPYSPQEILQSLQRNSPNHSPFYFLLLSFWGNITTNDIVLARVMSVLFAMLAMALVYRLGTDFVEAPVGLFALIIVASNAYFNHHIAFARMYTLLLFLAAAVLWLYLRIMHQQRIVRRLDYLSLGVAVYLLVNTFLFSASFLIMLGVYHLLIAPKNRRWRKVSAAFVIAVLLFSPWLTVVIPDGFNRITALIDQEGLDALAAIRTWLTVTFNDAAGLFWLSAAGLALGLWKGTIAFKPWMLMCIPFFAILALAALLTDIIAKETMRYHFPGWLLVVLLIAAGLYGLYRLHPWLGMLVLLWAIAGYAMQTNTEWLAYLGGRAMVYGQDPMHIVSRQAVRQTPHPPIIGYQFDQFPLHWGSYINYSQWQHYFDQHELVLRSTANLDDFEQWARYYTIGSPEIWVFYRHADIGSEIVSGIDFIMHELNYHPCERTNLGILNNLIKYGWETLNCQAPELAASYRSDLIDYEFYGAQYDEEKATILLNDRWTAHADVNIERINMSYQVIDNAWAKVAQLDLPLVREDQLRLFTIDVADVPAGHYRLMVIVYDDQTGEKHDWHDNSEAIPSMLQVWETDLP